VKHVLGVAAVAAAAGRPTVGISLAPSKTPTVKQQQAAASARKQQPAGSSGLQSQHSIDDALHDLNALHLSPRSAAAAAVAAAASVASDASVHGSVTSMSEAASEVSGAAAAAAARNKVSWKPLADYHMEADLHRCVAAVLWCVCFGGGSLSVAVHANSKHNAGQALHAQLWACYAARVMQY
jgi:hypothetical protein